MGLTREERQLLHQKSKQPTFGSGKPDSNQGNEGDIAYRQIEDSGLVQYVKQNGSWVAVGSQGDMPKTRDVIRTISSGEGEVGSHSHGEFIKKDGSVTYTGNQSFGSNNITNVGNLDVDGATTLDQTTIDTTDGELSVSGSNNVNITPEANITLQSKGATSAPKDIKAIGGKSDFTKHGNVSLESYNKITESGTSASNYGANGIHILADAGNATTKHNNIFIEQKNTPEKANGYGIDIKSSNGVRIRSTNNSAPSPAGGQPTEIKMFTTGQIVINAGASSEPTSNTNIDRTWIKEVCELETLYKGSGSVINCSTHNVAFDQLDTQKLMRNFTYVATSNSVLNGNTLEIVSSSALENTIGTMYMVIVAIKQGSNEWQNVAICSRIATTTWLVTTLGQNGSTSNYGTISADSGGSATGIIWTNNIGSEVQAFATAQRIVEASDYP